MSEGLGLTEPLSKVDRSNLKPKPLVETQCVRVELPNIKTHFVGASALKPRLCVPHQFRADAATADGFGNPDAPYPTDSDWLQKRVCFVRDCDCDEANNSAFMLSYEGGCVGLRYAALPVRGCCIRGAPPSEDVGKGRVVKGVHLFTQGADRRQIGWLSFADCGHMAKVAL